MQRVGAQAHQYYVGLVKLAWTETIREETLKEDRTPRDKPKESVYDTILRLQPLPPDDKSLPFYLRFQSDLRLAQPL